MTHKFLIPTKRYGTHPCVIVRLTLIISTQHYTSYIFRKKPIPDDPQAKVLFSQKLEEVNITMRQYQEALAKEDITRYVTV